jgi:hypothetical protein
MNPKKQPKQPSQQEIAEQFITAALNNGVSAAAEIKALAEGAGIARNTLERAKSALGVKSVKQGDCWRWELPAEGTDSGQHLENDEHPQEPQDSSCPEDGALGVLDPVGCGAQPKIESAGMGTPM